MKSNLKQLKLEKLVSSIKMRFNVEPEIQNNAIKINAGPLALSELAKLEKYCHNHAVILEVEKSVTFKITLS